MIVNIFPKEMFHCCYVPFILPQMVSVVAQALPLDVIPEIIGPDKPLMKIRCFVDEELLALLLKIMQTLLSIKNIPLLEAVYKYVPFYESNSTISLNDYGSLKLN